MTLENWNVFGMVVRGCKFWQIFCNKNCNPFQNDNNNVSTKEKDNKTVMEHKSNDTPKRNITRIPEFWIRDKSENGEQQN